MSSAADAEHAQDQLKPEAEQPKQEEAPSNKAGGKVLEGLTKRRQAEADLFCGN